MDAYGPELKSNFIFINLNEINISLALAGRQNIDGVNWVIFVIESSDSHLEESLKSSVDSSNSCKMY